MRRNKVIRLSSLILLLFFLPVLLASGCRDQNEPPSSAQPVKKKTLRIGLIPEHNIFTQKKRYQPLADYLARKTQTNIELLILSRYGNIINNFNSEMLDGAFFGSFTGALAIQKLGVEPLARPEYPDGISTYYGMILVRKDSGIETAQEMKGKRFAFVDKATTAGWLLPLHYFQEGGISEHQTWLGETYFTGTHEDAIYDVLRGEADAGAAKSTVFSRLAKADSRILEELEILAASPPVPANALLIRGDLQESLKQELQKTLLGMDSDPEGQRILEAFGANRFIKTAVSDYQPVFEYARHAGLDLTTYDYLNE